MLLYFSWNQIDLNEVNSYVWENDKVAYELCVQKFEKKLGELKLDDNCYINQNRQICR